MRLKRLASWLLGLTFIPGCARHCVSPAPASISGCELVEPWQLRFSDGSGNGWIFSQAQGAMTFRYEPVRRERSSSGVYDGGEPRQGPVTERARRGLVERVLALAGGGSPHAGPRRMGTCLFTITNGRGGECRFLSERGGPLDEFVAFLREEIAQR